MNYPKKLRVTKKWPGGPDIGTVLTQDKNEEGIYNSINVYRAEYSELKDFTEPVNDVDEFEFWYVDTTGCVQYGKSKKDEGWGVEVIPASWRFREKEYAEAFRDWMKNTYGRGRGIAINTDDYCKLVEILNNRVPANQ